MSAQQYITLRQENERWGWSRHSTGMTWTSHATYPTRALADEAARSIAQCRDIPYLPAARGGYDRTATQYPGLLEQEPEQPAPSSEKEEDDDHGNPYGSYRYGSYRNGASYSSHQYGPPSDEPQQDDQDAIIEDLTQAAIAAGHDRIRVLKAVDLVRSDHVYDAGGQGEWIVFSEQVETIKPSDFYWTPGVGKAPPAQRYIAAPQPAGSQRNCTCPDADHRWSRHGGKCKHWLAAVIAANLRRRLGDAFLFALPREPHSDLTPQQKRMCVPARDLPPAPKQGPHNGHWEMQDHFDERAGAAI